MKGIFCTVLLSAAIFAGTPAAQTPERDRVWVWNPRCPAATKVALRVLLDGKTVYATSLPLCRWERGQGKGKASFRLTPARPLVWYGYRTDAEDGGKDPGDTTAAGTVLEVGFWQAGGESDGIELGYTVLADDGLHMNSIHALSPTQRRTSTMAPGLVLKTWPQK